jgi:hypothetical protein
LEAAEWPAVVTGEGNAEEGFALETGGHSKINSSSYVMTGFTAASGFAVE